MNKDILQGNWKQLKGRLKEKWGEFTDDELTQINGKKDVLAGKLQEKYGMTRKQADQEINDFLKDIKV
ncbi:CsbD family protein [bacterium]|nr:CsbD family protein [bacterium]